MYSIRTTIKVGNREFDFVFDQDTNKEQLDKALTQMTYLAKTLPEEQPSKTLPDQSASKAGESGDVQSFRCNRVVVTGTLKDPRVEMYESNPALKFPILKCPITIFERFYQGDTTDFKVVGNEIEVDWQVRWKRSDKDPKYKDLYGIEVLSGQ